MRGVLLVFLSGSMYFSCSTKSPPVDLSVGVTDSILFEKGYRIVAPLITKYGGIFHYDKGIFGVSLPFVGNFYLIDSLGEISELTGRYSTEQLLARRLQMNGMSFNGEFKAGSYYSYLFSGSHQIQIFDILTGDLSQIATNLEGSVRYSDVFRIKDDVFFTRYGSVSSGRVFQLFKNDLKETELIHSFELDSSFMGFPPYIASSTTEGIYLLKQASDSIFRVDVKTGDVSLFDVLNPSEAFFTEPSDSQVVQKDREVRYSRLRVMGDTSALLKIVTQMDSNENKRMDKILTIKSQNYQKEIFLPDSFLGLGPNLTYFSLLEYDSLHYLHIQPIRKLF